MITFIVASSAVMVFIVAFWFEHKSQLWRGGLNYLKPLYLDDYAEFESKISYLMFLHDDHSVCEISTVRTLTLRVLVNKEFWNSLLLNAWPIRAKRDKVI